MATYHQEKEKEKHGTINLKENDEQETDFSADIDSVYITDNEQSSNDPEHVPCILKEVVALVQNTKCKYKIKSENY